MKTMKTMALQIKVGDEVLTRSGTTRSGPPPQLVELEIMVATRRRGCAHDQRTCRRSGGPRQEPEDKWAFATLRLTAQTRTKRWAPPPAAAHAAQRTAAAACTPEERDVREGARGAQGAPPPDAR